MNDDERLRESALCWERAGYLDRAYAPDGEPISDAHQWLASTWTERARQSYRQALEKGLSTSLEVEALLGLGEIELASDRAFAVASENGRSVEALCSLARWAAANKHGDGLSLFRVRLI